MPKRILLVAHNRLLKATRVSILETQGYRVESVESDDAAMIMLETEVFDLILIGRNSGLHEKFLDQRLRDKYPQLLTLKVSTRARNRSLARNARR